MPHSPPGPPNTIRSGHSIRRCHHLRTPRWNRCRRNAPHELRQHDQVENPHILFGPGGRRRRRGEVNIPAAFFSVPSSRKSGSQQTHRWRKADSNPRSHSHESFCRGAAEGRSRNDWLGSRIKLWSSREMAIGCAPSPRPVHGETEISHLVCSGREPELSLPLARDDTGVRNNLPPAARVQLRYQFPTRPAIVNEAAPEIAMPGSKRSISRR